VRDPQPVEHLGIAHQRSAAFPAGHQHHIGAGKVGDREVRLHPKGAGVGSLKPRLFGDKAKLHPWQAGQDFVRADRVQGREAVEDQDRDLHRSAAPDLAGALGRVSDPRGAWVVAAK
jgi:hypothetical protein